MNTTAFLRDPRRYFDGAYDQFCAFGGPCVYFHRECLVAGGAEFLSNRHIETLYATLTAWGMHRMGDSDTARTKLTEWDLFRESLRSGRAALEPLRDADMLKLSENDYSNVLSTLSPYYRALRLSVSGATIVVNSKALYHLLPRLIPPIDRQYTIRFFRHPPEKWRNAKGKFTTITLPAGVEAQFELFCKTCVRVKALADRVGPSLLVRELNAHGVTAPKAIDNAIVNFVRLNSGGAPLPD